MMKNHFTNAKVILVALASLLFFQTLSYAQTQTHSFVFGGRTRYYKVFRPQNFQSNMPVVFNLHGYLNTAQFQMDYTVMNNVADTAGFIVVYPDAIYPGFNSGLVGYPGLPPLPANVNDVLFISALIDTLEANYDIDLNRVYCCGLSNGGIMTYRLAIEIGDRFAAIASVSGVLTDILGTIGNPPRSIPLLHFHGTGDNVVTYNGGLGNLWSVDSTLNFWIQNNNCMLPPDTILLPDLDPNDGCTVQKISYTNCSDDSKIIFYKIIDGGHSWPGAPTTPSWAFPTNRDIIANVEIWNFFKNYELVTSIETLAGSIPSKFTLSQNYPNPFNPVTNIEFSIPKEEFVTLKIYNQLGQEVKTLISHNLTKGTHQITWNATDFSSGIYFYTIESGSFKQTRKLVLMK